MADYIALPRLIQKMHNIALTVKCIISTKKSNTLEFGVTENSPKFQATEVQEKRLSSSRGGAVNSASMQIENSSTIDRSDHLTVRSVSEEQQSWVSGYSEVNT